MKFDLDYIEKLVTMVSDSELTELALEDGDRAILLKKEKRNKKGKNLPSAPDAVLPLTKLFNKYNPLQRSAFKMALLVLAMKLLSRIANDITYNIAYGAPSSFGEILIMIIGIWL